MLAGQAPTRSAARAQEQHAALLRELESDLATGNSTAVVALLGTLEPELDKDERFALDVAYRLIAHRLFSEAAAPWNRAAKQVQASLQASSGQTLSPAADRALQRRFAEVVFVQGLLTARLGEKAEALRLLRQADGYGFPPFDSPLMAFAAECLYELKEYALAAQAYREIVKSAPQNAEARLRLGVSLYSSGQLVPAEKELEQALRQAPSLPHAHYTLGAVLFEQKRVDEARTHLERELASDPRCTGCMAKLAHIAYLKGNDPECRVLARESGRGRPERPRDEPGRRDAREPVRPLRPGDRSPRARSSRRRPATRKLSTSSRSPTSGAGTPRRPGSTRRSTTS